MQNCLYGPQILLLKIVTKFVDVGYEIGASAYKKEKKFTGLFPDK